MKIGQKLIFGFLVSAALTGAVGTISIIHNSNTQKISGEEVYKSILRLDSAWRLMEAQEQQQLAAKDFLFMDVGQKEKKDNYFLEKERLERIYQRCLKDIPEHIKQEFERYKENMEIYNIKIEEAFKLYEQGADLETIKNKAREAAEFTKTAHDYMLVTIIEHVYEDHIEPAKRNIALGVKRAANITIAVSVIAVFIAISLGLFISFSISRPIIKLKEVAVAIGKGNLDIKVIMKSKGEIGILADSLNKMSEDIKRLMQKEKELAIAVTTAAAEKKKAKELEKAYHDLQKAKDMLIQTEKLCAVGQLASGVAHEVRNPLGVIIQGVNYIARHVPNDKDVLRTIEMVRANVKRANNIVCALVDFSRVTKLAPEPQGINAILEDAIGLIAHKLTQENIEIIKEMEEGLPEVLVEKGKMEQVFVNLFLNSIQAMPKGGKLFIRSYSTRLKEQGNAIGKRKDDRFKVNEKVVMIEVEDTGVGISKDAAGKIFDPFFTTKGPREGAGLGLSVTKNIIDMHGGLLGVKSEEGKGAKITIVLKICGGI